ncbi:MAG: tetratricopeptide repeat protein [Chitinophagaceae bacterium]
MKRIIVTFFCLILLTVFAQSQDTGKSLYYYQRYHSAENIFHDQLRQHPDDGETWLWLTKSYISQNNLQKAEDSLAQAPGSISADPFYLVAKGLLALQHKNVESASFYFNQAIDITKGKNAIVLGSIAEAGIMSPVVDSSYTFDILHKAIKKDKNNSSLYVTMGNGYLKLHDGNEAFKAYREAIGKDKNNAEAYYRLGTLFLSQKNPDVYLDYFNKAIVADKNYAPAWYELYSHYLYIDRDPVKALQYFGQYAAVSDQTIQREYANTDLLYLTKDYTGAIAQAKALLVMENSQPRLYKLIAYSYGEMKDTTNAFAYMQRYFQKEADSNFIVKDFETMADLYISQPGMEDSVIAYYQKAITVSKDSASLFAYYKKLADLSKVREDYVAQAKWLGKYFMGNSSAGNVDLFNWGLSAYRAEQYSQADSVFAMYTEKYPEQGFGYYWRARSNAAIDSTQEDGLAIPYYTKLVEVIGDDSLTATNKKWMIEAYSYMAAYETNTQKDYKEAIDYFGKILEIDPENATAKKYIAVLEKNVKPGEVSN